MAITASVRLAPRIATLVLALASLLVLPGCWVFSVEPLYEENLAHPDTDLEFDQNLVGSWWHADEECPWTLAVSVHQKEAAYDLTETAGPECKTGEGETRIVPEDGASNPAIKRMRVVLPAPSGPTKPVIRPDRSFADSPSKAAFFAPGKIFRTDSRITRSLLIELGNSKVANSPEFLWSPAFLAASRHRDWPPRCGGDRRGRFAVPLSQRFSA